MPEALSNIRLDIFLTETDIFLTESLACKHGCEKNSVMTMLFVYITF
jgi:hypothetical protein